MRLFYSGISFLVLSLAGPVAHALPFECGPLTSSFGPFDYRTISPQNKQLVEGAHFLLKVEVLKEGNTARLPGGDIAYTLHVMPNHPRALLAMERLSIKEKTPKPSGARYSTECYMLRGIEFTPDDPMPHMIYSIFLEHRKRKEEALHEAETAEALNTEPRSYEVDYNLGLIFLDLGKIDKAIDHSDRAYAMGADFPGLKARIAAARKQRP